MQPERPRVDRARASPRTTTQVTRRAGGANAVRVDDRETVQRIVDGKWRFAARAREACARGEWRAFVKEHAPPVPRLFGRREIEECRARAIEAFSGPRAVAVRLVPTWVADADEGESDQWFMGHALFQGDAAPGATEIGPRSEDVELRVDRAVVCEARAWRVAYVVESRSYAPDIAMLFRGERHSVLEGEVIEIASARAEDGAPVPRPRVVVPPFASWFEPRVDGLSEAEVAAIRAMSITVDEDGALVPRP